LLRCIASISDIKVDNEDEKIGIDIIKKSLEAPIRQIAANSGVDGSVVIEKIQNKDVWEGFDALNFEYTNLLDKGIIDPTKVTRSALQNAESIASMFLTTKAVVVDMPEKKENSYPEMPGSMEY